MTTLTAFQLTPLGLLHTVVSLAAVVAAFVALARDREVSPRTGAGRAYLITLVVTTLTGLPIFRSGAVRPPHILGGLTLVLLAVAAVAGKRAFGRASAYVGPVALSATVLLLMIATVTETLTRVPPGAPLVASPEAPVFLPIYLALLAIFAVAATLQVRRLKRGGYPGALDRVA